MHLEMGDSFSDGERGTRPGTGTAYGSKWGTENGPFFFCFGVSSFPITTRIYGSATPPERLGKRLGIIGSSLAEVRCVTLPTGAGS